MEATFFSGQFGPHRAQLGARYVKFYQSGPISSDILQVAALAFNDIPLSHERLCHQELFKDTRLGLLSHDIPTRLLASSEIVWFCMVSNGCSLGLFTEATLFPPGSPAPTVGQVPDIELIGKQFECHS